LLTIASYYISKHRESRSMGTATSVATAQSSNKLHMSDAQKKRSSNHEVNLSTYSNQNVDRFAVLLDIWTNEVNFLEMKKNVISCFSFLKYMSNKLTICWCKVVRPLLRSVPEHIWQIRKTQHSANTHQSDASTSPIRSRSELFHHVLSLRGVMFVQTSQNNQVNIGQNGNERWL